MASGGLNLLIEYGYDGTDFFGSQIQKNKPTVCGTIEAVLEQLYGTRMRLDTASRTDRGVHARHTGATVRLAECKGPKVEKLKELMNTHLPMSVRVQRVRIVPDGFHARYNAVSREYRYRWRELVQPDIFESRYTDYQWQVIDKAVVTEAVSILEGLKSFEGFFVGGDACNNYLCNILHASVKWYGTRGQFRIISDRFLYHMIRRLMWAIFKIGTGELSISTFRTSLECGQPFRKCGLANAKGLTLWKVCFRS